MPILDEPQCPQCSSTLPLRLLWRVAPTGRDGLVLTGKVGIVCPRCGAKLRILQTRIRIWILAVYAVFGGCIYYIGWMTREAHLILDENVLFVGALAGVGVAQFLLWRYTPQLAQLRLLGNDERVQFPLARTQAEEANAVSGEFEDTGDGEESPEDSKPEWTCPHCREENPASFEICWNCEEARPGLSAASNQRLERP